jgi:hypothetical protein
VKDGLSQGRRFCRGGGREGRRREREGEERQKEVERTNVKDRDSQRNRRVVLIPIVSDPQWERPYSAN